jgi:hypothetical protein
MALSSSYNPKTLFMKTRILFAIGLICFSFYGYSQFHYVSDNPDYNPIDHTSSFLLEAPDAKASAMGEVGVATTPDAASSYWNPAKYAFIDTKSYSEHVNDSLKKKDLGFLMSYRPVLRNLIDGSYQLAFSAYKRLDDMQTIATSFNYYSGSEITFTNQYGQITGHFTPVEWSADLTYSRKVSKYIALAASFRYIYSKPIPTDMAIQGMEINTGNSLAADLGLFYSKPIKINNIDQANFSFGANISNIGSKMTYVKYEGQDNNDMHFIPANLRLGTALSLQKEVHAFEFAFDINKLLIPTNPVYEMDSEGNPIYDIEGNPVIAKGKDPDVSVGKGMIQSFYDAPNGFKEEMQEISYSAGMEYCYNHQLAARLGYHHQHKNKGERRYFTVGAGVKYRIAEFDFAYYIPTEKADENKNSPYKNSWIVTLKLNFNTRKSS